MSVKYVGRAGPYSWVVYADDDYGRAFVYTPSNEKIPIDARYRWERSVRLFHKALKKVAKTAAISARRAGVP